MSFTVPGSVVYRDQVLQNVARACRDLIRSSRRGGETFTNELVSAVGEAFNNIALHAYDDTTRRDVELELEVDQDAVTATLKDFGKAFDPKSIPDLASIDEGDASTLSESGMGLYIIRAFVDELDYQPGSPNVLMLRKRLSP